MAELWNPDSIPIVPSIAAAAAAGGSIRIFARVTLGIWSLLRWVREGVVSIVVIKRVMGGGEGLRK